MKKYCFTEEDDRFLSDNYRTLTYREMADYLGLTVSQVNHRLNRHLINKEDKKKIKYFPNENFFKVWTREMAYILGFICADGFVYNDGYKNKGKLGMSIHLQDKELLIKIVKCLSLDDSIVKERKNSKMCEFSIYNLEIYYDLIALGVMESKSLKLKWINVPKQFRRDFIRGYFDGDGSITIQNAKNSTYKKPTIQFLGTSDFLNGIAKVFEEELNIPFKNPEKTKTKINCLRYRTKQARIIMDYLYDGVSNTLYLSRKKEKYDKYKKEVQRLSKT